MKLFGKKNNKNNKSGFTLIELLIVIAIIGILETVVLVRLIDAKGKARDAAIMKSTNALMKMAQISSVESGVYSAWVAVSSWIGEATPWSIKFASVPNSESVIATCNNIINNVGSSGYYLSPENRKIFMNTVGGSFPKLTIMVALPYAQKLYCIGSNGGSSKELALNGSGCLNINAGTFTCSGCLYDPNGGGN